MVKTKEPTKRELTHLGKQVAMSRRGFLGRLAAYGAVSAGIIVAENEAINYAEEKVFGEFGTLFERLEEMRQIVSRDIGIALELVANEIPERLAAQSQQLQTIYDEHVADWRRLEIINVEETQALEQVIQNLRNYEESYTQWEAFRELFDRVSLRVAQAGREVESRLPGFLQNIHEGINELPLIGAGTPEQRENIYQRLETLVQIYDSNRDNLLAQEAVISQINQYLDNSELSTEEETLYLYLRDTMEESARRGNVNEDVREFIRNYNSISGDLVQREQLERLQTVMTQLDEVFDRYVPTVQQLQSNLNAGIELQERLRGYDTSVEQAGVVLNGYQQEVAAAHNQLEGLKHRLEELDIRVNYEPDFQLGIPVPEVVEDVMKVGRYGIIGLTVAGLGAGLLKFWRRIGRVRAKEAYLKLGEAVTKNEGLQNVNSQLREQLNTVNDQYKQLLGQCLAASTAPQPDNEKNGQ